MKIVVISDTHVCGCEAKFPDKLLEDIKSSDMIIHTGDFIDMDCLKELKGFSKEIKAVCGNMDSLELKAQLPEKEVFRVGRFKIGIMHGRGAPANLIDVLKDAFKNDHLDLIVFGHSHIAFNEKIGDTIFFNPGSPFDKFFCKFNSYGVIEINEEIETRIVKI